MSLYSDQAYLIYLIEKKSIVYYYQLYTLVKKSFPDKLYLFEDDNFTLSVKKFLFRSRVR